MSQKLQAILHSVVLVGGYVGSSLSGNAGKWVLLGTAGINALLGIYSQIFNTDGTPQSVAKQEVK